MPKRLSPPFSAKNKSGFLSLEADVIVPFWERKGAGQLDEAWK